jgi:predicted tellurium resistance membrane protein TerC
MDWITDPQIWLALVSLTAIEVVLGIDNIIFISIISANLPPGQQPLARRLGLALAMFLRIGLLFSITWIMRLTTPLFSLLDRDISARDLILIAGGLFLLAKATFEIHGKLEGGEERPAAHRVYPKFSAVLVQILLLDLVFSLDSVITAVGMANRIGVMVAAIVIAVAVMLVFAESLSSFVERHPTLKMLALSFLLLIGMNLVADGLGHHVPKGYIYFAMGFSVFVEALNIRLRKTHA